MGMLALPIRLWIRLRIGLRVGLQPLPRQHGMQGRGRHRAALLRSLDCQAASRPVAHRVKARPRRHDQGFFSSKQLPLGPRRWCGPAAPSPPSPPRQARPAAAATACAAEERHPALAAKTPVLLQHRPFAPPAPRRRRHRRTAGLCAPRAGRRRGELPHAGRARQPPEGAGIAYNPGFDFTLKTRRSWKPNASTPSPPCSPI